MKYTPKKGEVVVVDHIPACNFCYDGTPGPYDFATRMGPWANGCEDHWKLYRANPMLGVGMGQLWITADQVEGTVETGSVLVEVARAEVLSELRVAVANGLVDDEMMEMLVESLQITDEEIKELVQ